ncbi:hypothetical protein FA13DRAFT_1714386 [Coprinellus micaceus]|uniref:Uncharacterized protein n=1 Tax=Coprinellus micaceus TaxID=71717 RepID=A0A4Y7STZ6_COPMI|nr:hypothetical protein FA13DRAFT_1714386 [Coprinellus micaceus]
MRDSTACSSHVLSSGKARHSNHPYNQQYRTLIRSGRHSPHSRVPGRFRHSIGQEAQLSPISLFHHHGHGHDDFGGYDNSDRFFHVIEAHRGFRCSISPSHDELQGFLSPLSSGHPPPFSPRSEAHNYAAVHLQSGQPISTGTVDHEDQMDVVCPSNNHSERTGEVPSTQARHEVQPAKEAPVEAGCEDEVPPAVSGDSSYSAGPTRHLSPSSPDLRPSPTSTVYATPVFDGISSPHSRQGNGLPSEGGASPLAAKDLIDLASNFDTQESSWDNRPNNCPPDEQNPSIPRPWLDNHPRTHRYFPDQRTLYDRNVLQQAVANMTQAFQNLSQSHAAVNIAIQSLLQNQAATTTAVQCLSQILLDM